MSRFLQLTFHKCGSQWVRDVLSSPELQVASGTTLSPGGGTILHISSDWPEQSDQTFLGPLYNASTSDWMTHRRDSDKSVVILRDPRDLIVSLLLSSAYSHGTGTNYYFPLLREPLLALDNRNRMILGIFAFRSISQSFSSWSNSVPTTSTYVTKYERLAENPLAEFARIVEFFGWQIPDRLLASVVDRFSFTARSGRKPGTEEVYSHYRKGVIGDWKNYFDKGVGSLFEGLFPGLLNRLGYEQDSEWPQSLVDEIEPRRIDETNDGRQPAINELRASLAQSIEDKHWLQYLCREKDQMIEQLSAANKENLAVIESLQRRSK